MSLAEWTQDAVTDLEEIVVYIAIQDRRRETAKKIAQEIRDKADLYATQPEAGRDARELGEGIRTFTHKRWVIIYREISASIEVLRIVDGSRDYDRLFQVE